MTGSRLALGVVVGALGCYEPLDVGGLIDAGGSDAGSADATADDAGPGTFLRIVDDRPYADGAPVAGARVVVHVGERRQDVVTDADGVARIAARAPEAFDVTVYSPGYVVLSAFDVPAAASDAPIAVGLGALARCEARPCGGEIGITGGIERIGPTNRVIASTPGTVAESSSGGFYLLADRRLGGPQPLFGIEVRTRMGRTELVGSASATLTFDTSTGPDLVMTPAAPQTASATLERSTPGALAGLATELRVVTEDVAGEIVHVLGIETIDDAPSIAGEVQHAELPGAVATLHARVALDRIASQARGPLGATLVLEEPPAAFEARAWDLTAEALPIERPPWAHACALVLATTVAHWAVMLPPDATEIRLPPLPSGVRLRDVAPVRLPVPFGLVCFRFDEAPSDAARILEPTFLRKRLRSWAFDVRADGTLTE